MLLTLMLIAAFVRVNAQKQAEVWIRGDSLRRPCQTTSDCSTLQAYCFDSQCFCLSTHIAVNGRCLPKIKPGESPCQTSEQCTAVWPNTRCINTICQCDAAAIQVLTRDGVVCAHEYLACPFGGREAVLKNNDGSFATCTLDTATGRMSGCNNQMHAYDCIRNSDNSTFFCCPNKPMVCNSATYEGSTDSTGQSQTPPPYLPLNRGTIFINSANNGNTPQDFFYQGSGQSITYGSEGGQNMPTNLFFGNHQSIPAFPKQTLPWYLQRPYDAVIPISRNKRQFSTRRWTYNSVTGQCHFYYDNNDGTSPNSFETMYQCENYCRASCRRGAPLYTQASNYIIDKNKTEQYSQREQMCAPKTGCDSPDYECQVVMPGKALCCPTRTFICSPKGGINFRSSSQIFDEGIACSNTSRSVQRWYYDKNATACRSFQYKGCAGNYNNFLTQSDCRQYCSGSDRQQDDPTNSGTSNLTLGDTYFMPNIAATRNNS